MTVVNLLICPICPHGWESPDLGHRIQGEACQALASQRPSGEWNIPTEHR